MKKLFILFIAVAGFGVSSFAQLNVTATATARIITPLGVSTSTTVMDFGNIAAGATGGTVVLTPAGTVTATGGAKIPLLKGGTTTAATFNLTGDGSSTFTITLPSSHIVRIGEAGAEMTINAFTSTPSSIGTLSGGAATVSVGATITLGPGQAAGTYNSVGTIPITFNYN